MFKEHIKKISKDTGWVLVLNTVNYLSSFVLAVFISRYLGIEIFGKYSFIFALVLILGIVSDFGLSTLFVRKIHEDRSKAKELILFYNYIKLFICIAVISILFISNYLFFRKYFYPAFLIGILIILPRSLISTYETSIRSFLNQTYPAVIKSVNSLIQLLVCYYFLLRGYGLVNIFLVILISDTITLWVISIANDKVIEKYYLFNPESEKESAADFENNLIRTIKQSSVFFINNFLMLSIKGLNVILLGYLSTAVSVGIYSAGSKIVNGIGLFSGALFNSFYPVISNIKDNINFKIGLTKRIIFYAFISGSVITIFLVLISGFLIDLTFKISESAVVLRILSFTMIPVLVYTVTQSFLISVYNERFLMKILIIAWSLNIIISIVLIILYDYTGCAVSLASTEIFLLITQLMKFNYDAKKFELRNIIST